MHTFQSLALSHIELYVRDIARVEAFYTECLGFIVTDRDEGDDAMVFLSRNPDEHHQLVLNPRPGRADSESPVDHISFRVRSLAELRMFHDSIARAGVPMESVSHGTTWSLYLRDPERNRIEIFADTPWYVHQPCKFAVDFALSDDALTASTRKWIAEMPGFREADDWRTGHAAAFASISGEP